MSEKSVLVINTPKNCKECDCHLWLVCVPADEDIDEYVDASKTKPDWCPLKNLPEPKDIGYPNEDYDVGFASGWDACLEQILGEYDAVD